MDDNKWQFEIEKPKKEIKNFVNCFVRNSVRETKLDNRNHFWILLVYKIGRIPHFFVTRPVTRMFVWEVIITWHHEPKISIGYLPDTLTNLICRSNVGRVVGLTRKNCWIFSLSSESKQKLQSKPKHKCKESYGLRFTT